MIVSHVAINKLSRTAFHHCSNATNVSDVASESCSLGSKRAFRCVHNASVIFRMILGDRAILDVHVGFFNDMERAAMADRGVAVHGAAVDVQRRDDTGEGAHALALHVASARRDTWKGK